MADPEEQQVDKQKQYLVEKFGALLEQVGEGYGAPLQEELIHRLEKTIAEFHDEVSDLISDLKKSSEERHKKLKAIWKQEKEGDVQEAGKTDAEAIPEEEPQEISEWERRLESLETEKESKPGSGKKPVTEESSTPKKKLFGRKKK